MSLQVLVTFPGKMKLEKFSEGINHLREMGCKLHLEPSKIKTAHDLETVRGFVALESKKHSTFQVADALTPEEELLLDKGLEVIYKKGTAPLLNSMTEAGEGKLKPNMSYEIISYYKANPGNTTAQGAGELAERFHIFYEDVSVAFTKIRNLINTMCHAKDNQKSLEKRGGYAGKGGAAQVFAI
jgi:hypothetical protein